MVIREVEICEDTCNPGTFLCEEACFNDENGDGVIGLGEADYSGDGACDDGGPNSNFSVCELGSDCEDCGVREVDPFDGVCDDGGANSDFNICPLGTDCTDCGARVERIEEGGEGRTDALIDTLELIVQCWHQWGGSNDVQGCYTLEVPDEVEVGGDLMVNFGTIDRLGDFCDGALGELSEAFTMSLRARGFDDDDVSVANDLIGCGLLNLRNLAWSRPITAGTNGAWCIYYAPAKAGFGFPQDRRSAIVVDACSLSSID